jgi:hypothetical protein
LPLLFCQPVAPVNEAVIVWLPTARVVVLNAACPLAFTATFDARVVDPSLNVTFPTGTPALDVTVAANVTDCPNVDGFGDDVTEVEVALPPVDCTTCGAALSLPLLFCQPVAPVNEAVIVWLPTARVVVLNAACPLPFTATFEASVVAPSVKVTVPVGMPAPDVTVAVNVTDCPNVDGLGAELTEVEVAAAGTTAVCADVAVVDA